MPQVMNAAVMSMTPQVTPAQTMAVTAREVPSGNDDAAIVFMGFPRMKIGWARLLVKG